MRHRAVDDPGGAHYIDGSMRQRVPRQPSTKWWFLLAALVATAITAWQAAHAPSPPATAPPATARPVTAPPAPPEDDLVWIEIDEDAGPR